MDSIDNAVLQGPRGAHEVVSIGVTLDRLEILASVVREQLVEPLADIKDFARVDVDIRGLSLKPPKRLVNHYPRIGKAETLALCPTSEEEGAHTAGLTNTGG